MGDTTASAVVAIRRKRDGKYLIESNGIYVGWADKPRFVKSEAKAKMLIRVDLGGDFDEFEIVQKVKPHDQ